MRKVIPGLKVRIILDLLYFLFLPTLLLLYIGRRKYHPGWLERICFGRWRKILREKKPLIWIHAVSLGEAKLGYLIYQNLKMNFPEFKYLLTTVTPVGEKFFSTSISAEDYLAYFPLDFSFLMGSVFSRLNLKALIILETEIWPNFIIEAKKRLIPLGLVNARISKRAYLRYRIIKNFIVKILNLFDFVCLSGRIAQERFKALGLRDEVCYLSRALKFDFEKTPLRQDPRIESLREYLVKGNYILFIAGSTHAVEDILVFKTYHQLRQKHPELKFLIAPRHLDKVAPFIKFVKKNGYEIESFSRGFNYRQNQNIFFIDETGYLSSLYELADLVFIGGSLVKRGGHNVIEPALFKKAILIGPYYYNFEEIVSEFLKNKAILISKDGLELQDLIESLLKTPALRVELGKRAYETVISNRGALAFTMKIISSYIK